MSEILLPLYQQIQNYVLDGITNGLFKVGSVIPTEKELCELFKASRATVNKAITNLVLQGNVYRTPGKGSYVRMGKADLQIRSMFSFTEKMASIDKRTINTLLNYSVVKGGSIEGLVEKLAIEDNDLVHQIIRKRLADDEAIAIEISYINSKIVNFLDVNKLEDSLYTYLEEDRNLSLWHQQVKVSAIISDNIIAQYFGEVIKEPLLLVEDLTFLRDGSRLEVVKTYYLGSKFSFEAKLNR